MTTARLMIIFIVLMFVATMVLCLIQTVIVEVQKSRHEVHLLTKNIEADIDDLDELNKRYVNVDRQYDKILLLLYFILVIVIVLIISSYIYIVAALRKKENIVFDMGSDILGLEK